MVSGLKFGFEVRLRGMGTEKPATALGLVEIALPVGVALEIHLGPVVESRSFEVLVGDLEPERFNQVKLASGGRGQTTNVASIVGDLRFN